MKLVLDETAEKDYLFFKKNGNKIILKKIQSLLSSIEKNPYSGIGKPERLKHQLSGKWSLRINEEHRIIYSVIEKENKIIIYSLKGSLLKISMFFLLSFF